MNGERFVVWNICCLRYGIDTLSLLLLPGILITCESDVAYRKLERGGSGQMGCLLMPIVAAS